MPGRAVLADESDKAKLAQTGQLTAQNSRKQSRVHTLEFFGVAGPTFNLPVVDLLNLIPGFMEKIKPRLQFGPGGRRGHTRGRYMTVGGSGAVKSAIQSTKTTTDLYRVEKTVYVLKTGDAEPTAFRTWSLDWMTHREARRLAGLDDGTTLAKRDGREPYAPAYLTEDHPPTLGMSRVVQFLYPDGRYTDRTAPGDSPADT
ncbi:hypothetical protein AB4Z54_54635, partial [Streptomyces sp. MCAF7]